jgi:hypothetical protein
MHFREEFLSGSGCAAGIVEIIMEEADGTRGQLIREQSATSEANILLHFACFARCSPSQLLT